MEIRKELIQYIEKTIKPKYAKLDWRHDVDHFYFVVNNCIDYGKQLLDEGFNVDLDMAYTIGAYHDLGLKTGEEGHAKRSADILRKDKNLLDFFTPQEIEVMALAIEDHPSLLDYEPRSLYGKLIADAERNNSISLMFARPIKKFLDEQPQTKTKTQIVTEAIKFVEDKFGREGYVKFWLAIDEVIKAQDALWELLENRQKCRKFVNKLYDELVAKKN